MDSNSSKFAVSILVGAFEDEHTFDDPLGLKTKYVIRREGSNRLQALARERAKGDKMTRLLVEASAGESKSYVANAVERGAKAGIDVVDILGRIGEARREAALLRLVKWYDEPNGVEYNAGTAREFLSHDYPLPRRVVPDEAWKILEDEAREMWEIIHKGEENAQPFDGLKEISVGEAYVVWILHWAKQTEAFRAQVLEEAGKN